MLKRWIELRGRPCALRLTLESVLYAADVYDLPFDRWHGVKGLHALCCAALRGGGKRLTRAQVRSLQPHRHPRLCRLLRELLREGGFEREPITPETVGRLLFAAQGAGYDAHRLLQMTPNEIAALLPGACSGEESMRALLRGLAERKA